MWETRIGRASSSLVGKSPHKEKGRTMLPALSSSRSPAFEKTHRFFFFFAAFFGFFLTAFFLGFDFFAFFLGAAFFFTVFLAGFFAAGFVASFGAGFGAGASSSGSSPTTTSSSSSVSTISSVSPASSSSSSSRCSSLSSSKLSFSKSIPSSPGGIFGPHAQKGPGRRCYGRSYLKFRPVLEPLLSYSPGVVKHSTAFLERHGPVGGAVGTSDTLSAPDGGRMHVL